jgi:hypothetical protein
MPERATVLSRSEKSAEAVVVASQGRTKGRTRRSGIRHDDVEGNASDVRVSGAVRQGQGEALSEPGSDEALCPRLEAEDTGPGLLSAVLARENMQQA